MCKVVTIALALTGTLTCCDGKAAELSSLNNFSATTSITGGCRAQVMLVPALPGENHLFVAIHDAQGRPVTNASIRARSLVPIRGTLRERSFAPGLFEVIGDFRPGSWNMNLVIAGLRGRTESLTVHATIVDTGAGQSHH